MANSKKKRMSLLDNLAATGMTPALAAAHAATPMGGAAGTMMSSNRALRSARDAVDGHHVWELDPTVIDDLRPADRLNPEDVVDLRDAIEANGQTVPILVRRNPKNTDRYLLIYGRRRLEAIRASDKVPKVRALVAQMDDDDAIRAQISENMARRDLSFIEKALLAKSLVAEGLGNQSQVAEILTVTKSSVSMSISVVDALGEDLVRAIGAAYGVGRPRWDALVRNLAEQGVEGTSLVDVAYAARDAAALAVMDEGQADLDPSQVALEAVERAVAPVEPTPLTRKPVTAPLSGRAVPLTIAGQRGGAVKRTAKGVTLSLEDGEFARWVEAQAQDLINELHTRWTRRGED
ncbi:plasmid partitioning protein RepB [Aliiroseovarius lamellibrachiae]|uniref:plasmid partitioning protein RepB n=1 Tax=Aliiroseovarius lamellibrachiae TaxID=1924933 RepID=UPI001BE0E32F|nr:plasmid partitioning protein RepB [Aliiroseovarius lamellibrachiae]MBT2132650.1 plasmid partitioning protein RepB [Aliiroseovarius lamellibrachiae]